MFVAILGSGWTGNHVKKVQETRKETKINGKDSLSGCEDEVEGA